METTQIQSSTIEGNSGSHAPGLDLDVSYDRVYSIREQNNLYDLLHDFGKDFATFETTGRTRFNAEFIIPRSVYDELLQLPDPFDPCMISGVIIHNSMTERSGYVTVKIEHNTKERAVPDRGMNRIQKEVHNAVTTTSCDLQKELEKIAHKRSLGYTYNISPEAEDLWRLWDGVFDYRTLDSIGKALESGYSKMITVHGPDGQAAAGAMIDLNLGESTEWATHPDHQRQGLMQTALLTLHAQTIKEGYKGTIWGDMRFDSSTYVAGKIGMQTHTIQPGKYLIQTNHVNVGNTIDTDIPDQRNENKLGLLNNGNKELYMNKLRSFCVESLKKLFYQQKTIDTILKTAHI